MTLKIQRTTSKGVDVTIGNDANGIGLVILCQQITSNEHEDVKRLLEDALDIIPSADIFYAWGNASIFIFDLEEFTDQDREKVSSLLPKIKHTIIFNGKQMKGNTISEMYVTCGKNEIRIGKKFYTLFVMKKGEIS